MTTHHGAASCPECAPHALMKNNWFWGKCVVPRDLIDEQTFFEEALRLHHQRLHGSGIVCGLRVLQHPNPACRDRLLLLQPGSAIDCCGHHVLVVEQDVIDLHDFEAFRKLRDTPDGKPHLLQLCLNYRECPTEEVPVLYDECACDDTRCAPNRILQTYEVALIVDPPPALRAHAQPQFVRADTLPFPGARAAVLDDIGHRLFLALGDTVMEYDTALRVAQLPARVFGKPVRALALGAAGARLEVLVGGDAAADPELAVLDIAGPVPLASAVMRSGILAAALGADVALAETAAGELYAAIATNGGLRWFAAGVANPAAPDQSADAGVATAGLALAGDGLSAWLAVPGQPTLHVMALVAGVLTHSTLAVQRSGTPQALDQVLAISADGPQRLLGLDRTSTSVHLVDPASAKVEGSVLLEHTPMAGAVSNDGRWAYILTTDAAGAGFLQAVSLHALRQGKPVIAGAPFALGPGPTALALTATGDRLYVALANGVAVVDVRDVDCAALLDGGDCASCLEADCLVLVTIEHWQPGFVLEDMATGLRDAAADAANKIARLDNQRDRVILPSTQALAAALKCLIDTGKPSGPSTTGAEPGETGATGDKGDKGDAATGPDLNLTRICAINWPHAGDLRFEALQIVLRQPAGSQDGFGLVIAFTADVMVDDINEVSFMPLIETVPGDADQGRNCWCEIRGTAFGVKLEIPCEPPRPGQPLDVVPAGGICNAAVYFIAPDVMKKLLRAGRGRSLRIRVQFNGDLVRESINSAGALRQLAVDGNHLPPWVPNRKSGDGIEGGMFDSWLRLKGD